MEDPGVWISFGKNKQFQTLVSENQVERIKGKPLSKNSQGYVLIGGNGQKSQLSHFVAGKPVKGFVKDHINHNILDNRNSNLRNASGSDNAQNKPKRFNGTSSYKGVSKKKHSSKWLARASKLDTTLWASFDTELDAAKTYDKFCWRLYSDSMTKGMTNNLLTDAEIEFAKNNDPPLPPLKAKQQTLPKGITKRGNGYRVVLKNKIGNIERVTFHSFEAAKQKAKEIQTEIAIAKKIQLENMPITTNENQDAFITAGKQTKNPTPVLVDANLWHAICQHTWYIQSTGYAASHINKRLITLHHFIWDQLHKGESIPEDWVIDHANGDKTDCRSQNLRVVTRSENAHNRKKRKDCSSSFLGVYLNARTNKWISSCKRKYLGCFDSEEEASKAYQEAIKIVFPNCYTNV